MVLELKVFTAEEVGQVFAQFAQHGFGLRFFVGVLIFVHLSEQQRAYQGTIQRLIKLIFGIGSQPLCVRAVLNGDRCLLAQERNDTAQHRSSACQIDGLYAFCLFYFGEQGHNDLVDTAGDDRTEVAACNNQRFFAFACRGNAQAFVHFLGLETECAPFALEFLGLDAKEAITESDLEDALVRHLEEFLIELGKGFCFEARQ